MKELFEQAKWEKTKGKLLEGLGSKTNMVNRCLENQRNYLLKESAAAGATQASDIAGFRKILIPMIRRVIPGTIASELVGVQPMSGPVSQVYSLRYKYSEAVTTVNSPIGDVPAGSEMFGNTPPLSRYYSSSIGADVPAGGSGIGSAGDVETGIPGATANGNAFGANLDSTVHTTGTSSVWGEVDGSLRGGSGSFIEGSGGRKISLEVISQAVEAGTRKLQAGWTIESMQDMNSQHGMDIETELTTALSAEIVQEIDSEIINDLISLAGTTSSYDFDTTDGPTYQPAFVGDRFANLGVLINRVANEIGRKTRRGVGNFIVVSPMIVSVLQSAARAVFAPAIEGSFKGPNNTALVGTLNGMIKVYSYIWNQAQPGTGANDTVLVGYKGGNGETDSGYFYCPYIPLMSSGVVINPVTFQPVISLMTRYAKTAFTDSTISLGNSADYYGKVTINNLQFS